MLRDSTSGYEAGVGSEPTLTIHAIVGMASCSNGNDLRIAETADTVVVELVEHRRTEHRFCSMGGVFYERTVELDEPLGDRLVLDATSGEPIPPLN